MWSQSLRSSPSSPFKRCELLSSPATSKILLLPSRIALFPNNYPGNRLSSDGVILVWDEYTCGWLWLCDRGRIKTKKKAKSWLASWQGTPAWVSLGRAQYSTSNRLRIIIFHFLIHDKALTAISVSLRQAPTYIRSISHKLLWYLQSRLVVWDDYY